MGQNQAVRKAIILAAGRGGRLGSLTSERPKCLLRVGVHYYNGMSSQFTFFNQFEEQIGVGMWYDF